MSALRIVERQNNFNGLSTVDRRSVRNFISRFIKRLSDKAFFNAILITTSVFTIFSPGFAAETEIDGIIIDQTLTRIGAEMYRNFMLFWEPPTEEGIKGYSVTIMERASAQWGFWVWVMVNDTIVFQKVMKPQADDIESDAHTAVALVRRFLIEQKRGRDVELPDLKGNGI
ncbi:MAG: curli production assembly/transport protein CsgE [Desulfobacterota bacterium]|nr:curli production assembly/transport protein CsgE [Thermodesulfobacteriota bacterium]